MCENSVGIIIYMYANQRNCTSYIDFLCSILQIMYENTITLKFATAKKYGDKSAKADSFLPWVLLFSVSVNNWINWC